MSNLFKKFPVRVVRAKLFSGLFIFLLLFISSVSAIDTYWSIKNQEDLINVEKNPIGTWLINMDNGSVALFMALKSLGTVLVFGILCWLYKERKKTAWSAAVALAVIQFCLLIYLYKES